MNPYLKLLRINQWYKNIIIFLPLVFSIQLLSTEKIIITILGFIAFCIISSSGYIRNDIVDLEYDKNHPIKKQRPLPLGLVSVSKAYLYSFALLAIGLGLSFSWDPLFGIIAVLFVVNTEIYSRWLKDIIFVDVFSVGANFVIRAIAGIVLVQSGVSPWIILGVFFVAIFIAFMKRKSELQISENNSKEFRKSLRSYNNSTINASILISSVLVIITYSLYSMNSSSGDWRLILTVPIVLFVILRQIHLSNINFFKMQSDEILKDGMTKYAVLIYAVLTIYLLYFAPSEIFHT